MNRHVVLYLATLIVLLPLDCLFLGVAAKGFFTSQVGNMLGEIRLAPAILFYLLYVVGILIFVSDRPPATSSTLLYGALFGFFCYMTFELTSLSLSGTGPGRWCSSTCPGGRSSPRSHRPRGWRSPIGWRRGSDPPVIARSTCDEAIQSRKGRLDCFASLAMTESYFGCGTIRIYGFGDFQPCG